VGRQITATNALNQSSLTVYDEINRPVISVANWDGTPIDEEADCAFPPTRADTNLCTVIYYDARGQRSAIKDPLGNETKYGYDAQGRLITTTRYLDGGPVVSVSHYDALGNRIGQTDALSHTTTYIYDEFNRLVMTLSPESIATTRGYNTLGRIITITDGLGHQVLTDYDALGRRVAATDAEGHVTRYVYDGLGNQVTMTDANGVRTSYGYDGAGRLVSVVENDTGDAPTHDSNVLTRYAYDALGNRIAITNALGYTSTHTTYDALGRPITVKDALGHETHTRYNALGYRIVVTDANGAVTYYSYDGLNRLTTVYYESDGATVAYEYDAVGNRTAMTDTLGVTRYEYDDLYRLVSVTDPFTGTVEYGYNLAGNRTQLTYPDGKVVTYTYDADNRLLQVQDWDDGLTRYAYDAAGRLISTTLPNGVVTTQQYDDANRLVNLAHTAADDTLLASFSYEMDGVGNRTQITEVLAQPGTGITTTTTITYDYDPLQRLTDADYSSGERLQYAYDGAGNMTAVTATITSTVVTTKTYDAANRLTTVTTEGAVRTLDWSAAGELLRDGNDIYEWNAAGRLVGATVDGMSNRYAYLGDGGRISMTVGSETMTYTLDLATPLVQVLAVNGNGGDVAYLYGLARIGEYDSEWRYHLADHLGSVRSLVGADGSVKGTQTYQPYGSPLSTAGTASSMYGFTGEQTDPTGLVYLRARVYAPGLGQFMSRDSWHGDTYHPMTFNGFNYVDASPVNLTDPTGLSPQVACEEMCGRLLDPEYCECYCDWWSRQNHRDLTDWIVREMNANARDSIIASMWLWHVEFDRLVSENLVTKISFYPGYLYYDTLAQPTRIYDWYNLVKDGGRWDFKDKILDELETESTWLQTGEDGKGDWFEYSVTGNIHYGYVGRAAGFTTLDLHLGAGYAEIIDSAHAERGEQNFCIDILGVRKCGYFNNEWSITYYDDPWDYNAVQFGSMLFDIFGWYIPVGGFVKLMGAYGHLLDRETPPLDADTYKNLYWPYPVGHFDNPGN